MIILLIFSFREILALASPFKVFDYKHDTFDMTFWKIDVNSKMYTKSLVKFPTYGAFFID